VTRVSSDQWAKEARDTGVSLGLPVAGQPSVVTNRAAQRISRWRFNKSTSIRVPQLRVRSDSLDGARINGSTSTLVGVRTAYST
jgi:hypothetical protein